MDSEDGKAIVRQFLTAVNDGDWDALQDLVGGLSAHRRAGRQQPRVTDREWLPRFFRGLRGAFPDLHITADDLIAEGDKVVLRWTGWGTHGAEMFGLPPTGRQVTLTGITIVRLAGGKIVESWVQTDDLGLREQLGMFRPGATSG